MTDSEREEFVYDLASYYVANTSKAGLVAMAIDRMSDILLKLPDDELLKAAPDELIKVPQKTKDKRNKAKPTGF
jgi:hypothetical protein